jgi:hypothetical protein
MTFVPCDGNKRIAPGDGKERGREMDMSFGSNQLVLLASSFCHKKLDQLNKRPTQKAAGKRDTKEKTTNKKNPPTQPTIHPSLSLSFSPSRLAVYLQYVCIIFLHT